MKPIAARCPGEPLRGRGVPPGGEVERMASIRSAGPGASTSIRATGEASGCLSHATCVRLRRRRGLTTTSCSPRHLQASRGPVPSRTSPLSYFLVLRLSLGPPRRVGPGFQSHCDLASRSILVIFTNMDAAPAAPGPVGSTATGPRRGTRSDRNRTRKSTPPATGSRRSIAG